MGRIQNWLQGLVFEKTKSLKGRYKIAKHRLCYVLKNFRYCLYLL